MNWVREAISDNRTGLASSKRIVMLAAGITMSLSTLILTGIAYWKVEVVPALVTFGTALSALAGSAYVGGKAYEAKRDAQ